jgi:sec-independent protein translocase protein TatB
MFSIPHIAIIFVVALVVFGPEKLPELARNLGKVMGEFRRATGELRSTFEGHMRDLEREAELRSVRERAAAQATSAPSLPDTSANSPDALAPAPLDLQQPRDPAPGTVATNHPYAPEIPSSTTEGQEQLPFDTKQLRFSETPDSLDASAADRAADSHPEKVTDGRTGPA